VTHTSKTAKITKRSINQSDFLLNVARIVIEVAGGGTLHWPKLQCYTKTIVTKTKYAFTLMIYCESVCQITQIFLVVQERQFQVVERQLEVTERRL